MTVDDERFMRRAIEESKKSKDENDGRVHPKVGAVVVRDGKILVTAYRGEIALGDHAEYTVLERKLPSTDLAPLAGWKERVKTLLDREADEKTEAETL